MTLQKGSTRSYKSMTPPIQLSWCQDTDNSQNQLNRPNANCRAEDHHDPHHSEDSFDPSEGPQPEQPLRFDEEQDGPSSEAEGEFPSTPWPALLSECDSVWEQTVSQR